VRAAFGDCACREAANVRAANKARLGKKDFIGVLFHQAFFSCFLVQSKPEKHHGKISAHEIVNAMQTIGPVALCGPWTVGVWLITLQIQPTISKPAGIGRGIAPNAIEDAKRNAQGDERTNALGSRRECGAFFFVDR